MPPTKKYKKDDVINAALKIVEKEGMDNVSARRIAKELGTSPQPIFSWFESMEDVTKEIYNQIEMKYQECIKKANEEYDQYRAMGMAYILFARDYPEYFKVLYMSDSKVNSRNYADYDSTKDIFLTAGQKYSHLSMDKQKEFHFQVWLYTHGIACALATRTLEMSEEEIRDILSKGVDGILMGYKDKEGKM